MKDQLKAGSVLSYVQMALGIVIQLVYTPFMIRMLGKSEYGLYNTVTSAISALSVLSLGFGSGYIRYYSAYKKENDNERIAALNGLFMIIFGIIGMISLICGLLMTFNLNIIFSDGLTESEYKTAGLLMLMLTVSMALSFPASVFGSIISAHEKFIFLKSVNAVRTVAGPLTVLPLLLMGFRSVGMVAASVVISLASYALFFYYVIFVMKERFTFHGFEKGLFKDLFSYTIFIAVNSVIDQINWNIDKLLLGRFKGTGEVAVYSTGYTLFSCYMMFSLSVSDVFTPRIHALVNRTKENLKEQKKVLTELFVRVGRIQFLILMLAATGMIFFGKYFITHIMAGEGYENSYYTALLLMIPSSVALIQNLGIEIQRAQNKHRFRSIVYSFMAAVNLALSIVLCQKYGAVGSAVGTAISYVLANGIIMNIYYHKRCGIDILLFWKNIIRQCSGLVIPIIFGAAYCAVVGSGTFAGFILGVILYTAVYTVSVWLLSMNGHEKSLVKAPLRKLLRRGKA